MKNKLPSYEDCLNLCLGESSFYESEKIIDGYKISLFNYRLADNKDFNKPFAKEMRGICFVFNEDGSYRTDIEFFKKPSKLCSWCEFFGTHCDGK